MLEAVERGVQGTLLDLQCVVRDLLNAQQDAVPVERSEGNGLQDQEVERALEQLGRFGHGALLE